MDKATRFARLEDRVRGNLYDLTDAADWPSIPDEIEEMLEHHAGSAYSEMDGALHDWRAEAVKAAMAEIVARIAQEGEGWVRILAAVLDDESETIVAVLEEDSHQSLRDHDDAMLEQWADPYGPDHEDYEVRERSTAQPDGLMRIRDDIAAKVGTGCAAVQVEYVTGGAPSCPLVSITLPMSDARELAR
jgi:hypothetical protein